MPAAALCTRCVPLKVLFVGVNHRKERAADDACPQASSLIFGVYVPGLWLAVWGVGCGETGLAEGRAMWVANLGFWVCGLVLRAQGYLVKDI